MRTLHPKRCGYATVERKKTVGINVLSLFDGMSCGQIALERCGIEVDNYFASEIDKYAIQVAKKNYPDTVHIGDVTKVKAEDLPKIDLLIGGSPCQGFSTAGKELNFDDPRSKLFFEYVRLLKECKPKHFLLENVSMKKEFRDIISLHLGVEPVMINSSMFTAQNRPRYYWTNLAIGKVEDAGITLKDAIGVSRVGQPQPFPRNYKQLGLKRFERMEYRTDGKSNAVITNKTKNQCETQNGTRCLSVTECEVLQGVPVGYTESAAETHRYKMLGNGWTVPVIEHIFRGLSK